MTTNPSPHRVDDSNIQWAAIEYQVDGITVCHAVGGQRYIMKELKRLRTEFLEYAKRANQIMWSRFLMEPFGLALIDIDLTRHEC